MINEEQTKNENNLKNNSKNILDEKQSKTLDGNSVVLDGTKTSLRKLEDATVDDSYKDSVSELKTDTNDTEVSSPGIENKNSVKDDISEEANTKLSKDDRLQNKAKETSKEQSSANDSNKATPEEVIDVPDYDDYLLHLEDILIKLHKEFYSKYKPANGCKNRVVTAKINDSTEDADSNDGPTSKISNKERATNKNATDAPFLPDLKVIVPEIRAQVLHGCNLVFSSVVPRNTDLVNSKVRRHSSAHHLLI